MKAQEKNKQNKTNEPKEKTCFVVMPISNVDGYEQGHFKRVYDYLIKPACKLAGFDNPVLASEVNSSNVIILDILQRLVTVDMVICDLSTRNPNVMYEPGIRQAFNLPVTLIKDSRTTRIFDINSLRDVEYDESLRIDTIESKLTELAENIKNTFENNDKGINSLIELLGVKAATLPKENIISNDTSLILDSINSLGRRISIMENRIRRSEFDNILKEVSHIYPSSIIYDNRESMDTLWKNMLKIYKKKKDENDPEEGPPVNA